MAVGPVDFPNDNVASGSSPRRGERQLHLLILLAAVAVPLAGAGMSTLGGEQVALSGLERFPLPTMCSSRWLGVQCPTCGVTRSIIELMHGDWRGSFAYHRFGWLILLFIVLQIPYRAVRFLHPARRWPRLERWGIALLLAIAVVVVINHFAEVLLGS